MAFKAIILLTRRTDMTRAKFAQWWLHEHAPLAKQLPGARDARFNLVVEGADDGVDGISELWFDTREDFEAAYATELGKQVAADSMAHVSGRERLFVEEHAILDS